VGREAGTDPGLPRGGPGVVGDDAVDFRTIRGGDAGELEERRPGRRVGDERVEIDHGVAEGQIVSSEDPGPAVGEAGDAPGEDSQPARVGGVEQAWVAVGEHAREQGVAGLPLDEHDAGVREQLGDDAERVEIELEGVDRPRGLGLVVKGFVIAGDPLEVVLGRAGELLAGEFGRVGDDGLPAGVRGGEVAPDRGGEGLGVGRAVGLVARGE
jgi:hypothetical protein